MHRFKEQKKVCFSYGHDFAGGGTTWYWNLLVSLMDKPILLEQMKHKFSLEGFTRPACTSSCSLEAKGKAHEIVLCWVSCRIVSCRSVVRRIPKRSSKTYMPWFPQSHTNLGPMRELADGIQVTNQWPFKCWRCPELSERAQCTQVNP